ncbi:MAG: hypothetical protein CMC84_03540 [Flavobacteriaceae bacterium]|nr:hypothetical protein [Flavobacteriaceae bacterium]|tara:strand:+ start:3304 stop:4497 length:1194 start_codon:yes stop_codon:yes gene_type:complete
MKKLILILLSTTLISCSQNINKDLKEKINFSKIPAVVMGKINKNGKMVFFSNGPSRWNRNDTINENNIFRIASMTKAIGSVAALQLVEQGKITLDEPLDDYLPNMASMRIINENNEILDPTNSITLRHLLTHTAGFGYWFTSEKLSKWNNIKEEIGWKENYQPRLFESGTAYMYGTNIDWVGRLVENISGMNLEDYFRQYITGPLEMNSTWFNVPDELESLVVSSSYRDIDSGELIKNEYKKRNKTSSFNAGGGLSSSPKDYGKFLACMLNKGELNGVKILNKKTFELMNQPQLETFKTTHRYVPVDNVDTKARGDKDNFFDSHDNWTLAWAFEENSINRPIGTAYWAGFFNTYFTIDFKNEFALVYMTQILPFNDIHSYNLFTSYERLVYENLNAE